jgi:hypothetical protein
MSLVCECVIHRYKQSVNSLISCKLDCECVIREVQKLRECVMRVVRMVREISTWLQCSPIARRYKLGPSHCTEEADSISASVSLIVEV